MSKKALCLWLLVAFWVACREKPAPRIESIRIGVPYEIDTLDPHAKTRRSNFAICFNLYEPLVRTSGDMQIQPCLASGWQSPDATTWIFHLRPSVSFHDGRPMTAEDVKYSLQRLLDNPSLEVADNLSGITEVKALDARTILIHTAHPITGLLNRLSETTILPRGSTSEQMAQSENGTGPYVLKEWKKGQLIRMERNETYWGKTPEISRVDFLLNRGSEEAAEDLATGNCQLVQANSKQLEKRIAGLDRYQVILHDSTFLKYLSYDLFREQTPYCAARQNPFRNPLVRQAIHIGIDREQLVRELPAYALPASQPVPPMVFGFNPRIPVAKYDPQKAKTLLSRAGYPDGFEVTLLSRQIAQDAGVILIRQLAVFGIRTQLKVLPDTEYFATLDRSDFSFFLNRLASTQGDASDILEGALHSRETSRHYGSLNYAQYSNPDIDRAIEESAGVLKQEERRTMLESIMSDLMQDLPWIPLYIDQEVYGLDRNFTWQPRHDGLILVYEIKMAQ